MMPEPRPGESVVDFRSRLRVFFDRFATPRELPARTRRSWVEVMERHGVDPGVDFTDADPSVAATRRRGLRVPLVMARPGTPMSTMTVDERAAFVSSVSATMGERFEAEQAVPAVVTSAELEDMVIAIDAGRRWGESSDVPRTPEHHAQWLVLDEQVAAIKARGGMVELDMD